MQAQEGTSALNTSTMHKTGNFGHTRSNVKFSNETRLKIEEEGSENEEQEVKVSQKYLDIIKA